MFAFHCVSQCFSWIGLISVIGTPDSCQGAVIEAETYTDEFDPQSMCTVTVTDVTVTDVIQENKLG